MVPIGPPARLSAVTGGEPPQGPGLPQVLGGNVLPLRPSPGRPALVSTLFRSSAYLCVHSPLTLRGWWQPLGDSIWVWLGCGGGTQGLPFLL